MTLVLVTDKSRLIAFHGGPHYPGCYEPTGHAIYTAPKNTLDPRFAACTDHHPACDCREAEFAEEIAELRYEYQAIRTAFDEVLAGHLLYDADDKPGCLCTGCQIARAAHIWPRSTR